MASTPNSKPGNTPKKRIRNKPGTSHAQSQAVKTVDPVKALLAERDAENASLRRMLETEHHKLETIQSANLQLANVLQAFEAGLILENAEMESQRELLLVRIQRNELRIHAYLGTKPEQV